MSKTLTPSSIKKIESIIIKKIWTNRKNSKWSNFQQTIRKTYEEVKPIGSFGDNVDEHDFFEGIGDHKIHGKTSMMTIKEFREQIKKILFTFQDFEFYVRVPSLFNFPNGTKIVNCESIDYNKIPITEWSIHPTVFNRLKSFKGTQVEKELFLKFRVKTIGERNAHRKFEEALEYSLHVLRYFFHDDIRISEYYFIIKGIRKLVGSSKHNFIPDNIGGYYQPSMKNTFDVFDEIFTKIKPNDIETRIKKAVIIISISRGMRYKGFLLPVLFSALEVLFLMERDPITLRLAERIAFLIRYRKMKRIEVYNEIKRLYEKRSSFMHPTKNDEIDISEKDTSILLNYLTDSIITLLQLRNKGYTDVKPTGDRKTSVIDLVESIKFGQIKAL